MGFYLRDDPGIIVQAFLDRKFFCPSVKEGEALTLSHAINWLWDIDEEDFTIKINSQLVPTTICNNR